MSVIYHCLKYAVDTLQAEDRTVFGLVSLVQELFSHFEQRSLATGSR